MKDDHQEIAKSALTSASKGAAIAAASSILTGAAITSTPVTTFFGLVTLGTTTAVAAPVVITAGVLGAVTFGTIAGYNKYKKVKRINEQFKKAGG